MEKVKAIRAICVKTKHLQVSAAVTYFLPTLLLLMPAASRAAAGLRAARRRWPATRPPRRGQRPSPSSACRGCAQSVRAQLLRSLQWPDVGMRPNLLWGSLQWSGQVLGATKPQQSKLATARSWQAQTNCHAHVFLHRPHARLAKPLLVLECGTSWASAQRKHTRASQSIRRVVCSGTALTMRKLISMVASMGENSSLPSSAVASSSRVSNYLCTHHATSGVCKGAHALKA